jgi:hypothetical protein
MIMDGATLDFGAVAAVQNLLHPVTLARMIMEKTEHCFLMGQGAQLFARHNGIEILETTDLLIPRELEFYNQLKNDPTFTTKKSFENNKRGTVGAVAGIKPAVSLLRLRRGELLVNCRAASVIPQSWVPARMRIINRVRPLLQDGANRS